MKSLFFFHIPSLSKKFASLYHHKPCFISRAPGRAEIIGNHTDYNYGYALGVAISENTYAAVSVRSDNLVSVFSDKFDTAPTTFKLKDIATKVDHHWTNYVKAVVYELSRKKTLKKGFNLYITSDVPNSGGVSSSAALELAVGLALINLYSIKLSSLELALLCQRAENGPLVNSPCGFLDQGTCALAKKGHLTFFDFLPKGNIPVSIIKHIPINLQKHKASFVIVVDKKIKRNLGESGYPERRKSCKQSLPILSKLLKRKVQSLRDVSVTEFETYKKQLNKIDKIMRMRVEHIVYENQRVLDVVKAVERDNIHLFGSLLSESGSSALELYGLDEKTPELTYLLSYARKMEGVLGVRNMGGGFSANILVLINKSYLDKFFEKLSRKYKNKFSNNLVFIPFEPSDRAGIIYNSYKN